eukprot:scaffold244591_cov20-Tisochrysis_lutea.AAC.2
MRVVRLKGDRCAGESGTPLTSHVRKKEKETRGMLEPMNMSCTCTVLEVATAGSAFAPLPCFSRGLSRVLSLTSTGGSSYGLMIAPL